MAGWGRRRRGICRRRPVVVLMCMCMGSSVESTVGSGVSAYIYIYIPTTPKPTERTHLPPGLQLPHDRPRQRRTSLYTATILTAAAAASERQEQRADVRGGGEGVVCAYKVCVYIYKSHADSTRISNTQ